MLWQILWLFAAVLTLLLMAGAWTGPHRAVSNLSRWATRLGIRHLPVGLERRATDRIVFRGGLVTLVLLLAIAWFGPSSPPPETATTPASIAPDNSPAAPKANLQPEAAQKPARHLDSEMMNAIRVHIPKTKQIRIAVLKDDAEADQFAWEIDAFLRQEKYTVVPRLFFAMTDGAQPPEGTSLYPDQKDANTVVIRVGQNDRK